MGVILIVNEALARDSKDASSNPPPRVAGRIPLPRLTPKDVGGKCSLWGRISRQELGGLPGRDFTHRHDLCKKGALPDKDEALKLSLPARSRGIA
jgi:hypothetical protein